MKVLCAQCLHSPRVHRRCSAVSAVVGECRNEGGTLVAVPSVGNREGASFFLWNYYVSGMLCLILPVIGMPTYGDVTPEPVHGLLEGRMEGPEPQVLVHLLQDPPSLLTRGGIMFHGLDQ